MALRAYSMNGAELFTYIFVCAFCSLAVADEMTSILKFCVLLFRVHAPDERGESARTRRESRAGRGWWRERTLVRLLLSFYQLMRVQMVIYVILIVPFYILRDEISPVDILFNAVGALFVLELDNIFYSSLSERTRSSLEEPLVVTIEEEVIIEKTYSHLRTILFLTLTTPYLAFLGSEQKTPNNWNPVKLYITCIEHVITFAIAVPIFYMAFVRPGPFAWRSWRRHLKDVLYRIGQRWVVSVSTLMAYVFSSYTTAVLGYGGNTLFSQQDSNSWCLNDS